MNDKPKRLEDVTITCNVEPGAEADVEAMCEAVRKAVVHVIHEAFAFDAVPTWDRVSEVYAEEMAKVAQEQAKPALSIQQIYDTYPDPRDWRERKAMMMPMTYHRITATPGTPFKPSGPILPPSMKKETTMNITWTTGPGKQTARSGDREARLTKGGLYWYAEGHVDLQWGAVSLGASRDVVGLKQAAMAWLKGDAEWERHQRDLGFVAVYDETQAEEKEQQMTQKALDTLRQPAKK